MYIWLAFLSFPSPLNCQLDMVIFCMAITLPTLSLPEFNMFFFSIIIFFHLLLTKLCIIFCINYYYYHYITSVCYSIRVPLVQRRQIDELQGDGVGPAGGVLMFTCLRSVRIRLTVIPHVHQWHFTLKRRNTCIRDHSLLTGVEGTEILRGALIFGKSPIGGHLFSARKILKKPAKPTFPRVSDKNRTKKFFRKKFS